ncbi:MAG: hypothetical protein M0Z84_09540 [Gammaproteobacteria bacterium]|nr:hypothetical protein [Gammaproteobacteria bacterium]
MNIHSLRTLEQIKEFLAGTADVDFSGPKDEEARRGLIGAVRTRFGYERLPKGQRNVLVRYLLRVSGYSRQHLNRLIARVRETRSPPPRSRASRSSDTRRYG